MKLIYEGKAKRIFEDGQESNGMPTVIMEFKDSLTAFNALKKGEFSQKGELNLKFSQKIFQMLKEKGIANHFVENLDSTRVRVLKLQMLPVEVVVRNITAGSLAKRLGFEEGLKLKKTLVEFYLKNDALSDPLLTEGQIEVLEIMKPQEMKAAQEIALKINSELVKFFNSVGVDLVDFKIELGMDRVGKIYLADEITPDSCRLWDQSTKEKLDKDVFRRDLGDVSAAYKKIAQKIGVSL
jgi:phosphoribosylaminoimidazole-succinocarboxamide synthase